RPLQVRRATCAAYLRPTMSFEGSNLAITVEVADLGLRHATTPIGGTGRAPGASGRPADPGTGPVPPPRGRNGRLQVSGVGTSVNVGSRCAVSLKRRMTHGAGMATICEIDA